MKGGLGNDTYVVDNVGDVVNDPDQLLPVFRSGGTDTVESSITYTLGAFIENLTLTGVAAINGTGNGKSNVIKGNNSSNVLSGLGGNDTLTGGGGVDTLFGGVGLDTLVGGSGGDRFVLNTSLNATTNKDTITDFNVVDDTLVLENAIFTKFTATGALPAGRFVSGAGAVAADGNDYLLYNTTTGTLSYDADGNGAGAAVAVVTLLGNPALTAADFTIT